MKAFWISAVCLSLTGSLFAQSANYHLVKKTIIGGEGGWDYLLADADGGRLYVSHGTQVEVLDLKSHAKLGVITPHPGYSWNCCCAEYKRGIHDKWPPQHSHYVRHEDL